MLCIPGWLLSTRVCMCAPVFAHVCVYMRGCPSTEQPMGSGAISLAELHSWFQAPLPPRGKSFVRTASPHLPQLLAAHRGLLPRAVSPLAKRRPRATFVPPPGAACTERPSPGPRDGPSLLRGHRMQPRLDHTPPSPNFILFPRPHRPLLRALPQHTLTKEPCHLACSSVGPPY